MAPALRPHRPSKAAETKTGFWRCELTQGLGGLALGQANVGSILIPSHVTWATPFPSEHLSFLIYKMTLLIVPTGISILSLLAKCYRKLKVRTMAGVREGLCGKGEWRGGGRVGSEEKGI